MKLHAGTNVIEKSADFEESKFSIEASAKAFFILSDGLYSNKIKAVVRELSTNAYDSHVEAGKKNIPFDVHVPTRLEPFFYVRDYGTSMTHEQCMQLYTTYFRSTRNNSNDAVGCLGLGSKAPFAYADSFTVEAYLNGTKRIYTGYKNTDGSPVFSLLDEIDTDEQDGIKVYINVNANDINTFTQECMNVYKFFNVKPKFYGNNIGFTNDKILLKGDSWYFSDNDYDNMIIMGQIGYPIESRQFIDNQRYYAFLSESNGLRINANIGDVDITPSRESLSYSQETKNNIMKIVDHVIEDIANQITTAISSEVSLYKARMKFIQLKNQCNSISTAMESFHSDLTWNDIKLFDSNDVDYINVKDKITCKGLFKGSYRKKIDTEQSVDKFYFNKNTKFIVDDLNRGGLSRLKQKIKEDNDSGTFYFYNLGMDETIDNCRLYDIVGCSQEDVIITSTLPKVQYNRNTSVSSGSGGDQAIQIEIFDEERGTFVPCNMSVTYENACYFSVYKERVDMNHGTYVEEGSIIAALIYFHKNFPEMIEDMNFYLVRPSVIKNRKLTERSNWHDARIIFRNICEQIVNNNKQDIYECRNVRRLDVNYNDIVLNAITMSKSNNELKKIIVEYNSYIEHIRSISSHLNNIHNLHICLSENVIDINAAVNSSKNDFTQRFKKTVAKYPMLQYTHLGYYNNEDGKQAVADYIDSIEYKS